MTPPLIFLDCETTGLDPARHEIWEVAAIVRDDATGTRTECVWQLPVDLGKADTIALNIGRFHKRRWPEWQTYNPETGLEQRQMFGGPFGMSGNTWDPREMDVWCAEFARLTWGAHLVGAVVSFDADRLERLLRLYGQCPGWHYHLIDVEALGVGYVQGLVRGIAAAGDVAKFGGAVDSARELKTPPWSSEYLSTSLGVNVERFDRHTALGDAQWAEAMYDAVMKPPAR